jgi:glycosyltransferase involved in cell wall biosynthesis
MKPFVSVVIPTRNEHPHIFYTIYSDWFALQALGKPFEIIVVDDSDKESWAKKIADIVHNCGLRYLRCDARSTHVAKNMGVQASKGEYCFIEDAHILVQENFLVECIKVLEDHPKIGMVHSPFMHGRGFSGKNCFYNMQKFDSNMHGSFSHYGALQDRHYPVVLAPHAASVFRTQEWLDNGGYLNTPGTGGGEPLVTFKYWMFGQQVHIVPSTRYVHYRQRGYTKNQRQWRRNFVTTAYVLGGPKVAKRYAKALGLMYVLPEAKKFGEEQWKFVQKRQKYTFDELKDLWQSVGARPSSRGEISGF